MFKFQIGNFGVNIEYIDLVSGAIIIHILGKVSDRTINVHFSNPSRKDETKTELLVEIWRNENAPEST